MLRLAEELFMSWQTLTVRASNIVLILTLDQINSIESSAGVLVDYFI